MECNYRAIIEEKLVDTPTGAAKTLTKAEHFILCPPTLGCFHVSSSRRYGINITRLKPTEWSEDAMNSLIMDENKKTRLKCLVRNYTSGRIKGGDIIKNKGRGLTIVLYGPSGVGKTLTAECLAEYAKTPVIPLSVGNLVTDEDMIEDRLREAFSTASRLKAILLLDEADVVLEARSFEDVRRNGIVSSKSAFQQIGNFANLGIIVFLRQLEYYSGILILTTNRITSIDPAFQSRIQIALPYEELIPTQREQIWKSLMNAILVDVTDLDRVVIERELPRLSEYPLNGRQIRNTLQLSMLLASDDLSTEGRVQLKHIKQAMKEALEFQEFFEETKKDYSNKNRVWKPFMPLQNGVSR